MQTAKLCHENNDKKNKHKLSTTLTERPVTLGSVYRVYLSRRHKS